MRASLCRASHTWTARRWTKSIVTSTSTQNERIALASILLTEMTARPSWFRAIEWIVALLARKAAAHHMLQASAARITVGPLQISGAPWSRNRAVAIAVNRIRCSEGTIADTSALATSWNGANANMRRPIAYSEVLELAIPFAIAMVNSCDSPNLPART